MGKKNSKKYENHSSDFPSENVNELAKELGKKVTGLGAIILPFVVNSISSLNIDLRDLGATGKKLRRLVRDNPGAALALAAAVGFLAAQAGSVNDLMGGLIANMSDDEKAPEGPKDIGRQAAA